MKSIEEWKRHWDFRFWAVAVILGLVAAWFGFDAHKLRTELSATRADFNSLEQDARDRIKSLNEKIAGAEEEIAALQTKAIAAESAADRALIRAGDLQAAVTEAKEAVKLATNSSGKALEASENALAAAKEAKKALDEVRPVSSRAEAIAKTVDDRVHQLDSLFVSIKEQLNAATKSVKDKAPPTARRRIIEVVVTGTGSQVTFEPGPSPYERLVIGNAGYVGKVYVPDNAFVRITGSATGAKFIVASKLRDRVVNENGGTGAKLIQN